MRPRRRRRADRVKFKFIYDTESLTSSASWSRNKGSNFGPPGIARFRAFAVKKDLLSNKWK